MAQASARRGSQAIVSLRILWMSRTGRGLARPTSPTRARQGIGWGRGDRAALLWKLAPAGWAGPQAEEAGSVPACAGDQASNLGQAGMTRAVPHKALRC